MSNAPQLTLVRRNYRPDGGAEVFVARALEALGGNGVELTLIASRWRETPGVRFLPCRPFSVGRAWREWAFARCACRTIERELLPLVQSHERIPCCDIYRAGDGVHAEWLRQRERAGGTGLRLWHKLSPFHRYMLGSERRLFANPRLRAVICISDMVRREIRDHFTVPEKKLHVIYNGIDTAVYHPNVRQQEGEIRSAHGIPEKARLFLFVGSGFARKGMDAILNGLARLPNNAHLLVVGRDKRMAHYQRQCEARGIAGQVHFVGKQTDVKPFYGAADVLLHPPLYEPFGNVVLEAMACGLPVITSDKCGASEMVRHGHNGFVCDALDHESLGKHMLELLDESRLAAFSAEARQAAEAMSIEQMTGQLLALYRVLMSGGE